MLGKSKIIHFIFDGFLQTMALMSRTGNGSTHKNTLAPQTFFLLGLAVVFKTDPVNSNSVLERKGLMIIGGYSVNI